MSTTKARKTFTMKALSPRQAAKDALAAGDPRADQLFRRLRQLSPARLWIECERIENAMNEKWPKERKLRKMFNSAPIHDIDENEFSPPTSVMIELLFSFLTLTTEAERRELFNGWAYSPFKTPSRHIVRGIEDAAEQPESVLVIIADQRDTSVFAEFIDAFPRSSDTRGLIEVRIAHGRRQPEVLQALADVMDIVKTRWPNLPGLCRTKPDAFAVLPRPSVQKQRSGTRVVADDASVTTPSIAEPSTPAAA